MVGVFLNCLKLSPKGKGERNEMPSVLVDKKIYEIELNTSDCSTIQMIMTLTRKVINCIILALETS